MASIVFLARGINQSFEVWKKFMETQMFLWKRQKLLKDGKGNFISDGFDENGNEKFKLGETEITKVQGALRPLQLFEYTVPEECVPEVLAMQNLQLTGKYRPEIELISWPMRKLMGLEHIGKFIPEEIKTKKPEEITDKFVPMGGMAVYPLGVKRDVKQCYPNYGYYQEGL